LRSRFRPRRLRVAQLTVAATMLALPASAFALAGSTASDSQAQSGQGTGSITIHVSPAHVQVGQSVRISGTTQAATAGERVVLQGRVSGRANWRSLQTTTVGSNGRFAFVAHLRRSGLVRVVAAKGDAGQAADTASGAASVGTGSTATPVRVTADVVARQAKRSVLGGGRIAVHGRVLPVAGARPVRLQGHSGKHWVTLAAGRTRSTGRFTLRYRATVGTNRRLRVVFPGDAANARATAPAGTVTVYQPAVASWYYDAGLQRGCGFSARFGVANKTLPCGTKVQFRYGGRTVMATVDDRGPYVAGRTWDLGQSTRAALGFNAGVATVWASVR
jgi:rare lipoprotein A